MTVNLFKKLVCGVQPLLIVFLVSTLSSPAFAAVKVNYFISNELTHSSNLEVPVDVGSQRNALALTFNAQYQNLDYNGGYIWDLGLSSQAGSLDADEQKYFMLSWSKLSSLNDTWILRNNLSVSQFKNSILAANSYDQFSFNNTIGSAAGDNSGFDYSLNLRQQTHTDLASDQYRVLIPSIQAQYYFPHHKQQAYWSLSSMLAAHNYSEQTNDNRDDYRSLNLTVAYLNGQILAFNSSLKLVWQQDTYGNQTISNQARFQNRRHIQQLANSNIQIDQLVSVETRFFKPLNKATNLEIKLLWGNFSSNTNASTTDFYKVSSAIHWAFE